jgi:hypothetical protein
MITKHLYPVVQSDWLPLEVAWPEARAVPVDGHEPEMMMALVFREPDGSQHIYPFDSQGRQQLVKLLTGGVVIPVGANGHGG